MQGHMKETFAVREVVRQSHTIRVGPRQTTSLIITEYVFPCRCQRTMTGDCDTTIDAQTTYFYPVARPHRNRTVPRVLSTDSSANRTIHYPTSLASNSTVIRYYTVTLHSTVKHDRQPTPNISYTTNTAPKWCSPPSLPYPPLSTLINTSTSLPQRMVSLAFPTATHAYHFFN